MKQQISPKVLILVIAVGVLALAGVGYWVFRQPSITAAPGSANRPMTMEDRRAGGPTAEDLKKRDEYNRQHPDAAGSR